MALHQDIKNLKSRISYKVKKAATPRQSHLDRKSTRLNSSH